MLLASIVDAYKSRLILRHSLLHHIVHIKIPNFIRPVSNLFEARLGLDSPLWIRPLWLMVQVTNATTTVHKPLCTLSAYSVKCLERHFEGMA